ncbi:MAG: diguanylate cyclase, partial [Myxococcales bacterium]|nr:diguanylate cyclase [Myxococcales bacterium]
THRQIAAFLESHGDEQDGDLAYRLAHHYEAGGDKPKALEWLMRAGETALGEFSIREARGYFERAKLHVDSTTERDVARRLDERIGDINSVQGRPEEALVSYQNALADESAQGSVRRIKRKIGMLHQQTGDSRSAVRYLEESLRGWGIWLPKSRWTRIVSIIVQVLRWLYYGTLSKLGLQKSCASVPAHEQELVRIYETLSFATFYFDLIACYDYHLRHYNTLSRLGMKNRDVILCLMHAIASLDRGLFGRAMRFYKLAVGLMKRLQGVGDLARALKFQGAFLWSIGKLRNAVSTMRRALAAAEETGNSLDLNENLSILGNLYLDHGEFRSAIGAFERLNQSPYARDKVAALLGEAMASVYLGKLELAREKVGEAKAAADESPQPGIQVMLSYVAGHVTHKSGDWQGAWRELRQAYDLNQAEHIPRPLEIRGRIYILELLLDGISRKSKRRPWLLRQFRSMLRETRRMGRSFVCYHAWLLMLEGQFEEELGRRDSAVRLMRLALRSLRRAGMRFQYAEALVLFSRMIYADAGEPLGTALGLYQQMGLSREGQQIQRILSQRRRHSDDSSSWESSRDVQPHAYLTHRRELSSLLEINQALSAVLDYDELLTKIMDSVVQFAGAERGFLMTYGAEGSPLDVRVARNIDRRTIEGEAFRVSRNIINRVLETEKPVLISDAEADPDFNTAESVVRYNLRSILCIPLKHGKKILGVLYLENNLIRNLFTDADADLLSVLATQATISLQNARLFQMATTDSLTGAYLRRFMENRLKEEFERSERYGNPLSVLMVDVDHFKSVNDTYHHQVGDLVLQKIAGILKANVRDTDLVARYGGEEFCVLLPETTSERGLEVAQRLREAIASADVAPVPQVTASLGLATIPNDAISHPQKLIEAADKALYAAKESGRNRVCVASLEGPPESKSTTERTKPPPPPQAASQSKTLRSNK